VAVLWGLWALDWAWQHGSLESVSNLPAFIGSGILTFIRPERRTLVGNASFYILHTFQRI